MTQQTKPSKCDDVGPKTLTARSRPDECVEPPPVDECEALVGTKSAKGKTHTECPPEPPVKDVTPVPIGGTPLLVALVVGAAMLFIHARRRKPHAE